MELSSDARSSLAGLLLGITVSNGPVLSLSILGTQSFVYDCLLFLISFLVGLTLLFVKYKGHDFQVAIRAFGLGLGVSLAICTIRSSYSFHLIGWYLLALSFFHWSEFLVTAVCNAQHVTLESYMLDHSLEYHLAALGSCLEFFIEWWFFPLWKQPSYISVIGAVVVIGGECLRKISMITAKTNFNHYIEWHKRDEHELVTSGVYAVFRHPSYVGWFYWSVATQLMILNPVCMIAYAIVSWKFFNERIYHEEWTLVSFFGPSYLSYQQKVPIGLPFIQGFKLDKKVS